MNGNDDIWDYVRSMAYGPSQGEYTHDTLYGPLGALQPGDVAMSPNLQKKYPIGSNIIISPQGGNPFLGRVADHSYFTPGKPTKDSIELWNGQDLGHVRITAAPKWTANLMGLLGQTADPTRQSNVAQMSPIGSDIVQQQQIASNSAYPMRQTNFAQMSSPQDYSNALAQQTEADKRQAAIGKGIGMFGQALAKLGQQQQQQSQQGMAQAMQMMQQQQNPGAAYLQRLLMGASDLPDYAGYFGTRI